MTTATDQATRRARHWTVLPWIVLAVGIPASFLLFTVIRDAVERVARLRFERQASDAHAIIENRLHPYGALLYGLRALFASEGPVTRLRFHRYVASLDLKHRYPGFDAVNFATHVLAKDKKRFEESVRRDTSLDPRGYPEFAIKPPGERPEYYVVVYLEPMAGYEFAFGLDIAANPMAANPERLVTAIRAARDNGKLTASGQPLRIKQAKESIYLAMRIAVYGNGMPVDTVEQRRVAYLGSVGAGFNLENLMRGVLNEEMLRYMQIRLYDAGSAIDYPNSDSSGGKRLLFDSDQLTKGSPRQSAIYESGSTFLHAVRIEMADRLWEF